VGMPNARRGTPASAAGAVPVGLCPPGRDARSRSSRFPRGSAAGRACDHTRIRCAVIFG
jgi:hypothetical protein